MLIRFAAALLNVKSLAILAWGGLLVTGMLATGQQADESALEAFRKLHQDLQRRMDEDLPAAAEFLQQQIAAAPDSADLHILRDAVAARMMEQGDAQGALEQMQKLLDYQIKHVDDGKNQSGIWMTVSSIQDFAAASANRAASRAAVDRGYEALDGVTEDDASRRWMPLTQLAVLKAQAMARDGQTEQAQAIIDGPLQRLQAVNDSPQATEQSMRAQVRFLQALISPDRGNDPWRDTYITDLDDLVNTAVERFPQSQRLQIDYAETQFLMITQLRQEDPDATKERIEKVIDKLKPMSVNNRVVSAILRRVRGRQEQLASVKEVASLVGKTAPAWDIDAWVNAGDTSEETLKGKVLLVDFWAMWCGPCIATFDHLRQWREEFGPQGFEIVGVTQYYNFQWDADNERASRAQDPISAEQERQTLTQFLKHHELSHPIIVTPKESEMGSEYGVRGIPHVVLIDRDGVVQFVKTGAGDAAAKQIHDQIKQLLSKD